MAKKKKSSKSEGKKMTEKKDKIEEVVEETPVVEEGAQTLVVEESDVEEVVVKETVEEEVAKMPKAKAVESEVAKMIATRKDRFANTACFTAADAVELNADIAKIAIATYVSTGVEDLQAYLDYMTEYPQQIGNVVLGMDVTVKNGERQRMAVTNMQVAFKRIVMADKNNTPVQINLKSVSDGITNKEVVNFIASKVG